MKNMGDTVTPADKTLQAMFKFGLCPTSMSCNSRLTVWLEWKRLSLNKDSVVLKWTSLSLSKVSIVLVLYLHSLVSRSLNSWLKNPYSIEFVMFLSGVMLENVLIYSKPRWLFNSSKNGDSLRESTQCREKCIQQRLNVFHIWNQNKKITSNPWTRDFVSFMVLWSKTISLLILSCNKTDKN